MEVWKTILFGYTFPTKDVDGGKIRKTLDEYKEEESRKFQLNYRAIYILVCAMDRNEYNRMSQCKTAKEIWRILEITHEGTTQVKDSKVRILENELWKNKKPNISYFKVFGSKCFILNTKDNLGKFDAKSNVGIFFGYSLSSKAYRVFNKKTMVVEESVHVVFDESNESLERRESVNDDVGLDFSMGRLQIDDKVHQQEEEIESKKEESPFAHPPPPQLEQGESSQEFPKE